VTNALQQVRDLVPLALSNNSELAFVVFLVLAALACLLFFLLGAFSGQQKKAFELRKFALLFSLWVAATVLWGGYYRTFRIPGAFDLSVERAVFMVLLLCMAYLLFRKRVDLAMSRGMELAIFAFLLLCVVSMAIHGFTPAIPEFSKPWYIFLVGYLLPAFAFVTTKYFLTPEKDYPVLLFSLFVLGIYLSVVAILENYGLDSLIFPRYIADETIGIHFDRARGPFLNAAFNGQFLCIAFIAGMAVIPLLRAPFGTLFGALTALYVPAIWFTRTRSVYLAFLMVVVGLLFCYKTTVPKWKLYSIFGVLALAVLMVNLDRLASENRQAGGVAQMEEVDIRFELVNQSLELIAEHPAFGVGLGQFRTVSLFTPSKQEYQHNHLIGIAAELGLVGLGVYLTFLGLVFWRYFSLVQNMPDSGRINLNFLLLLGLALLVTLTHNTFVEPSLHTFSNLNFFIFAAMVDRLYNREILEPAT